MCISTHAGGRHRRWWNLWTSCRRRCRKSLALMWLRTGLTHGSKRRTGTSVTFTRICVEANLGIPSKQRCQQGRTTEPHRILEPGIDHEFLPNVRISHWGTGTAIVFTQIHSYSRDPGFETVPGNSHVYHLELRKLTPMGAVTFFLTASNRVP